MCAEDFGANSGIAESATRLAGIRPEFYVEIYNFYKHLALFLHKNLRNNTINLFCRGFKMAKILDWKKYEDCAQQAIAEGCVLVENNGVLPLKNDEKVSVFGRIQSSYYKSGTGSGGKVNVAKVYNIVDGLLEDGVKINENLQKIYADWEAKNPYDEGFGWGKERWSQDEMPLSAKIAGDATKESDVAIVIIGRTAGEEKDNSVKKGSYLLTDEEEKMIETVRAAFGKMVVLLNVGNIIDMTFVKKYKPDAVMYVWQGGMMGGLGTADVLTGKVSPCGHLTDTIAEDITDYPTHKYFGNPDENCYGEDIFCGYRYFETFAKDKVLYPFGYGLSYSDFEISCVKAQANQNCQNLTAEIEVRGKSKTAGKEVVQLYVQAPQGKLGKASRVLVDYAKTQNLTEGKSEKLNFEIPFYNFASFDDSGITGNKNSWILEEGEYKLFAGNNVRDAKEILCFNLEGTFILKQCEEACAPSRNFERMHNADGKLVMESVPLAQNDVCKRMSERKPKEINSVYSNKNQKNDLPVIKLADVLKNEEEGRPSILADFVAQFTDEDLACVIRGEGMGSSLVTPGTASAFGGVSPRLRDVFGLPACCCDDGPSGMRLDCGIKAFSLPNGTSLACTFNDDLITELYGFTALEMCANKVDNLLGPGMNIHRHPLNGRNFEYFSEDPLLTGKMAVAMLKGLHSGGVTGTIKHFAGNEQETNRHAVNSVVSQRALREIYLKGFEIAVKSGYADSVMTTYGILNGVYTAGNYDLVTTILREDWKFSGITMTDWWADISEPCKPEVHNQKNYAGMIKAQNDLYMVCSDGSKNADGDNTLESLENGSLSRAELQRSALNICNHVMHTQAMKRLLGTADEIQVINKPVCSDDVNLDDVEFTVIGDEVTIDLTYQECKAGANYILAFDVTKPGTYEVSLTGSSELNELAQLPCTIFTMGIPISSFTFNGTHGKPVTITKQLSFPNRFCVNRLFVADNGLKLLQLKVKYLNDKINFY